MKKRGFTLIELLVVIAVIAVLMGILMPSLRMAREQARSIVCSSNLKSLVLGWQLYAQANDDKIVYAQTPQSLSSTEPAWVIMPPNPGTASIEDKKEYIKMGALWPYVNNVNVYRCPSDRRKNSPIHQLAFRSYSIAGGLNGAGAGLDQPCKSLSDIKNPGRKYAFAPECDRRGYNMNSWLINPVSGQWVDALGIWHRGRSVNFGFVDSHVEKHSWQSKGFVDWCYLALDEPTKFFFYRDPQDGGNEELDDWRWALSGYAYKSLTGNPNTYGGALGGLGSSK